MDGVICVCTAVYVRRGVCSEPIIWHATTASPSFLQHLLELLLYVPMPPHPVLDFNLVYCVRCVYF